MDFLLPDLVWINWIELDFQDLDKLVFWKWTLVVFRIWIRNVGFGFFWIFRIWIKRWIWISFGFSGFGSGRLDLDSVAFVRILASIVM